MPYKNNERRYKTALQPFKMVNVLVNEPRNTLFVYSGDFARAVDEHVAPSGFGFCHCALSNIDHHLVIHYMKTIR